MIGISWPVFPMIIQSGFGRWCVLHILFTCNICPSHQCVDYACLNTEIYVSLPMIRADNILSKQIIKTTRFFFDCPQQLFCPQFISIKGTSNLLADALWILSNPILSVYYHTIDTCTLCYLNRYMTKYHLCDKTKCTIDMAL
jgi:hypothetical protein